MNQATDSVLGKTGCGEAFPCNRAAPSSDTLDSLVRWTCLLCGRDKFSRPGEPHRCLGGFRKRFKAEAARRGLDNAWVQTPNYVNRQDPGSA